MKLPAPTEPPSEEIVEEIARELCFMRGEQPDSMRVETVFTKDGSRHRNTTPMDEAKRDVRFVLGYVRMKTAP